MYIFYDFIFLIFTLVYLPYFLLRKKFHKDIWQRFYLGKKKLGFEGCIWLHAVSVGEVAAIRPLWERLRGGFSPGKIAVSTITKAGNELARKFSRQGELIFYLPLDFSFIVESALKKLKPKALIIAETEIWPNLIMACYKRKIPVILVNARISDKAFARYLLGRFALRGVLHKISVILCRSEQDRNRFMRLGATFKNTKVCGNIKYYCKDEAPADKNQIKTKFGINNSDLVFVAGSTHRREEEVLIGVYEKLRRDFKGLRLIIAPRHVERAPEIRRLLLKFESTSVIVIDKIGLLKELYSIADVVFVGGSLVKRGGHNIIEPAIFEKPILFGPFMFNFKDMADEFLKNNAAMMVKNKSALEAALRQILNDRQKRDNLARNAKAVVLNNQGAVERCLSGIKGALGDV